MNRKPRTFWNDSATLLPVDADAIRTLDRRGQATFYVTAETKADAIQQLVEAGYETYAPAQLSLYPETYEPAVPLRHLFEPGVIVMVSGEYRNRIVMTVTVQHDGSVERTVVGAVRPRAGWELAPLA